MYLDTRLFSLFFSGNQELRYDLITVRTKDIAVIKMLVVMDRVIRDYHCMVARIRRWK